MQTVVVQDGVSELRTKVSSCRMDFAAFRIKVSGFRKDISSFRVEVPAAKPLLDRCVQVKTAVCTSKLQVSKTAVVW